MGACMSDVLVVDDSSTMRRILVRALVECGIAEDQIRVATNGAEALASFLERPPGLMLCDVAMPVLDGVGLMERLRVEAPEHSATVLFVTSLASEQMREQLSSLGAAGVLGKPFDKEELRGFVEPYIAAAEAAECDADGRATVQLSAAPAPDAPAEDEAEWLAWIVRDCIATSLEKMVSTEPIELDEAPPLHRLLFVGQVNIGPSGRGLLRVAATLEASSALALLLSGEHPKRDDARRCDTMQELANIIGGAIVTAREAERGETWQLGVANGTVTPPGHHGLAAPLAYALNDRDERLFIDIAGLL